MKNIIVVTGGAGFVGSNLIEKLLLSTNFKVISIDNYSSGSKKNHIKNKRVKYIKDDTENIKLTTALHYKIKDDLTAIYAMNFGSGTTVYQGDNRIILQSKFQYE